MGDPHNSERYGETWPQHRTDAYLKDLESLKEFVVISGGFAWHMLSSTGHTEYKHAHDQKDLDLFVPKHLVGTVLPILSTLGYKKVTTIYDKIPSKENFRRYERTVEDSAHPACKLTIDFFVGGHPTLTTREGWTVVRPDVLLSFYRDIHSSDNCWAVRSATRLLENGETVENLVGNGALTLCPDLPYWFCTKCGWSGQFPESTTPQGTLLKGLGGAWHPGCGYMAHNLGLPTYRPRAEFEKRVP